MPLKLEMQREDGEGNVNETRPLAGLDVLDVGCGGGLLSEVRRVRVLMCLAYMLKLRQNL